MAASSQPSSDISRIQGWDVADATVEELLLTVRGFLHDEQERAESLNARGTGLTGFIGVILSIAGAIGALGGTRISLHQATRLVVGGLVTGSFVLLLAAVVIVVVLVLLPTEGFTVHIDEIKKYPTFEYISRKRVLVQGDLMQGYVEALARDRTRNDGKATWLRRSYGLVCVGLVLVALAGTAAALDRYVTAHHLPPTIHPASTIGQK